MFNNAILFFAGRLHKNILVEKKSVFVLVFVSQRKDVFFVPQKKNMYDVFQYVTADVGLSPERSATIVATSTVRTAVLGQKCESKRLKRRRGNCADNP